MNEKLLRILLFDRTTQRNILWAADGWTNQEISLSDAQEILPRIAKDDRERIMRTDEKAEIFTPRDVVALMNQKVDERSKFWPVNSANWQSYIKEPKLEICCGEAPFVVSRYDVTTGELLDLSERVGFLDAKMRVVSEFCDDKVEWLAWAEEAYKSAYAYEWQGDSLLLARKNLLYSFVDYYNAKFPAQKIGAHLSAEQMSILQRVAEIIAWNIFQMDGINYTVPGNTQKVKIVDWEKQEIMEFGDV